MDKIIWKIQQRGAYRNSIAFIDGVRVAIFRPTLEDDFVITMDDDQLPGSYATVALAKKAL